MRIAIAGSGGLAQHFAHHLNETVHPFIILSRSVRGWPLRTHSKPCLDETFRAQASANLGLNTLEVLGIRKAQV